MDEATSPSGANGLQFSFEFEFEINAAAGFVASSTTANSILA